MEGGETGGTERDGGVHHPQQERHHRTYLPRGGSHGQYLNRLSYGLEFVIDKVKKKKKEFLILFYFELSNVPEQKMCLLKLSSNLSSKAVI